MRAVRGLGSKQSSRNDVNFTLTQSINHAMGATMPAVLYSHPLIGYVRICV